MKKIKSYEYRVGWGSEDKITEEVNKKLAKLSKNGIKDVDVNITGTGKGVMYTIIWDE